MHELRRGSRWKASAELDEDAYYPSPGHARPHSLVCRGRLPLVRAQREIAGDWIAA
jgi:hypothetical protein